jgi:hypothetical protein
VSMDLLSLCRSVVFSDLLPGIIIHNIHILHISLSLLTAAGVHSTLQPYSSNQCDTARLYGRLYWRQLYKKGEIAISPYCLPFLQ